MTSPGPDHDSGPDQNSRSDADLGPGRQPGLQSGVTPVQIIGQPGAGKTTLVAGLVRHFSDAGLCVGTLKHSSHGHELDKKGKDSHVHRTAGACPAAMVTSSMAAIYLPASDATRPEALIRTYFQHLDLVLIEGWISGPWPKIELWRAATDRPPLFMEMNVQGVRGIATDDSLDSRSLAMTEEKAICVLSLSDLSGIAETVLALSKT